VPKPLTEIAIKAAKPPTSGTTTMWDGSLSNFGCRISPKGTRSFIVLIASGKRRTLGRYPTISLAEARLEAKRILAAKMLGKEILPSISVADALATFLADSEKRHKFRTARDYRRLLRRHLATFNDAKLDDVRTRDIAHIADRLRDTPSEAAHALVSIKVFFNWCVRRGYVATNPCVNLSTPKSSPRERVLTDDEIKIVYRHAGTSPYPFGPIVQLLLLTGQRRGEIGLLQWKWIDEAKRTITLPPAATKNNRSHTFPYGDKTADILGSLPRVGEFVFPSTREHRKGNPVAVVNGWSSMKSKFDRSAHDVAPWTLHDLRRTFATNLAKLGTPIHVTEKLLNHVSGAVSGVAAIYNRHAYLDEMRAAIDAWERRLSVIITQDNSADTNASQHP
jgi:integrase